MKAHRMLSTITLCLLLFSLTLSGCVTASKPNIPFAEPISGLNYIEKKNPLLATELRKLPEIQDGLNEGERKALERLSWLYRTQQSDFDAALREMYEVGLPEHRKYCSPLQALFWIAMERPFSREKNPINPYTLSGLLNEAWIFRPRISPEMINKIVGSIKDPEIRKNYEKEIAKKNKYIVSCLMSHAEFSPEIFEEWVPEKLEELKKNYNIWSDYNVVLDRLNSPELVHFYVSKEIRYSYYWEIPGYDYELGNPYYVFKNKSGDCLYISGFIVQALRKNGYSAWVEKMPRIGVGAWHAVCVFKIQGEKYIIDDGKRCKSGIMRYNDY